MKSFKILLLAAFLMGAFGSFSNAESWISYTNANTVNGIAFEGDYVWCATGGGAVRWNTGDGSYVKYTALDGLGGNSVRCVTVDKNGDKWFGTWDGGSSCLSAQGWKSYIEGGISRDNGLKAILADETGITWFLTDFHLKTFDGTTWKEATSLPGPSGSGVYTYSASMVKDGSVFWFTTGRAAYSYDGTAVKAWNKATGFPADIAYSVAVDRNGIKWFGTSNGAVSFDGIAWKTYTTAEGLANNTIYTVIVDAENVKWFGTEAGVSSFDGLTWKTYTPTEGLVNLSVISSAVDANNIKWFGTKKGLSRFDGKTWKSFVTSDGICDSSISAIVQSNGVTWFGTASGISRFDGASWISWSTDDGLIHKSVNALAIDSNGILWAGTRNGVSSFDGKTWTSYTTADGLVYERVSAIAVDRNNVKWFGTTSGISRFDGKTWISYKAPEGPSHNAITSIVEDHDGVLWFGTEHGWVCSFDGVGWKNYNQFDGLTSDVVYSAAVDRKGVRWFGGVAKLMYYDGKIWKTFDGKNSPVVQTILAMTEGPDGNIWVGSSQILGSDGKLWGPSGPMSWDGVAWKTWNIPTGLTTEMFIRTLAVDGSGGVWVGTSAGLYRIQGISRPTSVENVASLPAALFFTGNYPNPFNPSTTISFTLPASGPVNLAVYDITGRKVRDLVNGPMSAGSHSAVWDGHDSVGKPVSSGVYLSRLTQGEKAVSRRMLLVK